MPVAIREKILTDKRILHYMLRGFYGAAQQAIAEAEVSAAKRSKRKRRPKPTPPLSDLLSLL